MKLSKIAAKSRTLDCRMPDKTTLPIFKKNMGVSLIRVNSRRVESEICLALDVICTRDVTEVDLPDPEILNLISRSWSRRREMYLTNC